MSAPPNISPVFAALTADIAAAIVTRLANLPGLQLGLVLPEASAKHASAESTNEPPRKVLDRFNDLTKQSGLSRLTMIRLSEGDPDFPPLIRMGRTLYIEREAWNAYVDKLAARGGRSARNDDDVLDTRPSSPAKPATPKAAFAPRKRQLAARAGR